jgi:hypothetical protein
VLRDCRSRKPVFLNVRFCAGQIFKNTANSGRAEARNQENFVAIASDCLKRAVL